MISGQMMQALQQAMNSLWFAYKRMRDNKNNFGLNDKDVVKLLHQLIEVKLTIDKLIKSSKIIEK